MRMVVAGTSAGHGRSDGEPSAFEDSFHPTEILGGRFDLATASHQDDDFGARIAPEVDVGRRPYMLSPSVLGGREAPQYVRGGVSVEQRDHSEGVGIGIREGPVGQFLSDQRSYRVGSAGAVALLYPLVQ
jgi:hypothetical protein